MTRTPFQTQKRPLMQSDSKNKKTALKVKTQSESAGGIKAVVSSMKFSAAGPGLLRGTRSLLKVNQMHGFDCPGCAWPDPDDRRSLVEFCENGAKAIAEETTRKKIGRQFFAENDIESLNSCSEFELGQMGRLAEPLYLPEGSKNYQAISWPDAFTKIAQKLNSLESPNEAIFYTSGRTSNEAAFLYQLMVRYFGTNNLPDCSNMCHESSGVAMYETLGSGKGTVTLKDFEFADTILVIGQNPGTNRPRMLTTLQHAARRGCKIISINPLLETGLKRFSNPQEVRAWLGNSTPIATSHLPVKINGDVALLKGLLKSLLADHNAVDSKFIEQHTNGFRAFKDDIENTSWQSIVDESGINQKQICDTAKIIAASKNLICCWAMGLTQHQNAVQNIQAVINLLLIGGHFGRKGAGACPVRGHSNVQGDRTMGITERPRTVFLQNLKKEFSFDPPKEFGHDVVSAIQAMSEKSAKLFFALGGNFVAASPDTEFTQQALRNCELTVQVSTKLNRSHLCTGKEALILPCLGRTEVDIKNKIEQIVTVENSMGVVHSSKGHLQPISSELKSEVEIITGLAEFIFADQKINWRELGQNYSKIRDVISRVVPGFSDFNEKIKKPGGFHLYHPVRDELKFHTASGKAEFSVVPIRPTQLAEGHLYLSLIARGLIQYFST